ncbi:MAG TPA: nucleoside-diphosphate sugar epimerase/dehydratase [Thermoanaerobaculia bacterium]|nr:nucleoside-diphosphate sugar epimerase/dehydratase [Thermoanaerobaculia bacterium]
MTDPRPKGLISSFLARVTAARVAMLFLFHAFVFTLCYVFAWLLRFEFSIPPEFLESFKEGIPYVVGVQLLAGAALGFYRGWWRYVGISDVLRLVVGLTSALAVLVGLWYLGDNFGLKQHVTGPRGVLLIDWAFSLLTLFGARVAIRVGRDRTREKNGPAPNLKKVVIIGAGDAGEALAREIQHRPRLGMSVVSFIDDHRAKWGSQIRGIEVRGPIERTAEIADGLSVDEALIAIPSASGKRIREVIRHLSDADLPFKTIPGIDHLVSGKVHVTQLRPVNVEDLLRREKIELPGNPVRELFKGKRVLVTGAGGTIGSELASQVLQFEPESLALVERSEFALYEVRKRLSRDTGWVSSNISANLVDIGDADIMDALIMRERPQIVLHAAAHKHVPLGEENPPEYLRNNALATRKLAEICNTASVERFVCISTDKAINPTSVMGATKRAAEILLLDVARHSDMKLTIVRFGNVIGSSGSVIPLFKEQIAAGGPVTVTHPDVTRYFIRTSEAISLVLQAATLGVAGHIFMLDMGEPVKIADLARDLIRLSNHTEDDIPIVFTGMRSGEKLFEEIRLEGEDIRPTVHPQIVITESTQPQHERIAAWMERTSRAHLDAPAALHALQQLIPEYAPASTLTGDVTKPIAIANLVAFATGEVRSS